MDPAEHWESAYGRTADSALGWYQADPARSVRWVLASLGGPARGSVIDIGGGSSRLVDRLVGLGVPRVAVLDVSAAALASAKARLGTAGGGVEWIVADATRIAAIGTFDVWHDRAAFHFLLDPADRLRYVCAARRTLPVGSHLIVATFAPDGPARCSGLAVRPFGRHPAAEGVRAGGGPGQSRPQDAAGDPGLRGEERGRRPARDGRRRVSCAGSTVPAARAVVRPRRSSDRRGRTVDGNPVVVSAAFAAFDCYVGRRPEVAERARGMGLQTS